MSGGKKPPEGGQKKKEGQQQQSPAVESSGLSVSMSSRKARKGAIRGTGHEIAEHAKEVGRGGHRAGKRGVEVAKSKHTSVHDMTMNDLFPRHKA